MCGIVGAVAQRNVVDILIEGLKRLEYRGYDSAGLAVISKLAQGYQLERIRRVGKVEVLQDAIIQHPIQGHIGIAHTRWATHGQPSEYNAHPHVSGFISVVHNGIIENYQSLRTMLIDKGYQFSSETDTEVIAHLIHDIILENDCSLFEAVKKVRPQLQGTYGVVIMDSRNPDRLVAIRSGSPLVIGLGQGENFVASDQLALLPVTRRFIFLEEGDIVEICRDNINIIDKEQQTVTRHECLSDVKYDARDKNNFRHYMEKEIFEQPIAIKNTLLNRIKHGKVDLSELVEEHATVLAHVEHIQIVACGTAYHAGLVARYWFESITGIPCDVEIASEFRYRNPATRPNSLFITLSQSGETADTLAALRLAKTIGYISTLAICNVAASTLVREADLVLLTKAGTEVGVASTKAFTTQLTVLLLLVAKFSQIKNKPALVEKLIVEALQILPNRIEQVLSSADKIEKLAKHFADKQHTLFLGRGDEFPIALEGALKLKETSYIHAEAYAAGELKHGPLALVDKNMPVIVIAANNHLLDKLKSNIEEVRARGGQLYIFTSEDSDLADADSKNMHVIALPKIEELTASIYYTVPMQLLAYYVALIKGTDVDRPRNLAKSVTVE